MISIDNIGIAFGGNWVLKGASFQFTPGEQIALIGRNGAGKSSLLKVMAGDLAPSEGRVNKPTKSRIAFYHQDLLSFETDRSIFEVAREAFARLLTLKEEIDNLTHEVEKGTTDPVLWDRLVEKQDQFETLGGNRMDATVHEVLAGLGFEAETHQRPYSTFSGGWRMRVLLAKMLLESPDVLLLDEPTNHLDLPAIKWLEQYIKDYSGTCLIVSHDRVFIDRVASHVLEITNGKLVSYAGNYSFYLREKAQRQELQQRAYENQQKHIEEQERFINRFRAKATKARQVQSKIKQLEKLDRIDPPEAEEAVMRIRFTQKAPSGKEVLKLRQIRKAYDHNLVLKETDATVLRGDKIALIGANGTGKSTLLRIAAGTEPHQGQREEGYRVHTAFFAQHQLESLDPKNSILNELETHIHDRTELELRNVLGSFMFSGEEVDKKIQVLSGGERSRVALARTLLSEANFLLLDEPTNHLDIPSIRLLSEALRSYDGTFIVVSHDRFFLEAIANKIWYIEDQRLIEYPGDYASFEWWQKKRLEEQGDKSIKTEEQRTKKPGSNNRTYKEQKMLRNRRKKLEKEIQKAEIQIEKLESTLSELQLEMAKPDNAADFEKLAELQKEHDKLAAKLEAASASWEEYVLELEEIPDDGKN